MRDPSRYVTTTIDRGWVENQGVTLHVRAAGPTDGPLVLLLHGFPEFWYGWRHQIGPLAEAGYRVLVPDQRGYNLSDAPSEVASYDLTCLAGDVRAIIEAAGRDRAHIIGHDWGAIVAWWIGMHHPAWARRLAFLNAPHPTVFWRTIRRSPRQFVRSLYVLFFQIPAVPEWLLGRRQGQGLASLLRMSGHPDTGRPKDLEPYREAWMRPGRLRGMLHWYRAGARRIFRGEVDGGSVKPRALFLWGARDVALRWEMVEPSAQYCEDVRVERIEHATHWVQHDEPAQVNQVLLSFLGASSAND